MPGLAYGRWNDQQAVLQEMARVWSDGSQAPIAGARSDGLRTFTAFITFQPLNVQRKFGATEFFISLKYLPKDANGRDTFTVFYTGKSQANEDFSWEVGTITDG
jgi:hypothetical protein